MEIKSNYNTQNFNGKVRFYTLVKNQFSKAGRYANQEIAEIKATHPKMEINQENIGDKIELSFLERSRTGHIQSKIILSSNGIEETEIQGSKSFGPDNKFNLIHSIKRIFGEKKSNKPTEITETQTLINNNTRKIEETASRKSGLHMPVEIQVQTKIDRESPFPSTTIAGNLHPAQATKHTNADGDVIYIERYIKE